MKILMPLELLTQAGLTPTQAEILGFLLSQTEVKAKDIVSSLSKPRGVIYKGLDELVALGLVEKLEKFGAVTRFRAEHPAKLETLLEAKERAAQKERQAFMQSLPELVSQYNLVRHKPDIKLYEGEGGLRQVLDSTLRSKTEILIFLDKKSFENTAFAKLGKEYDEKRVRAGIRQRIIIADEPGSISQEETKTVDELTEIRYIGKGLTPFKSSVKIYENKTICQTIEDNQAISVVIEDRNIYEMNVAWFEFLWQSTEKN